MLTLSTILKEIKNVPVDRLEDLYTLIQSWKSAPAKSKKMRKKILSFAGAFGDMTTEDFKEFQQTITETRRELFDRNSQK